MAALATLPLKISPRARDREHTLKGWNRLLHATSGSNLTQGARPSGVGRGVPQAAIILPS